MASTPHLFLPILILLYHCSPSNQQSCDDILKTEEKDPFDYINCRRQTNVKSPLPEPGFRTNGVENFCVVIEESLNREEYGGPGGTPEQTSSGYEPELDSNFEILRKLAKTGAWSHQPTDNLPYNAYGLPNGETYRNREIHFPTLQSPNPWFIEVSRVAIKGDVLHGWLHFRVFRNRSVSLGAFLDNRNEGLHTQGEKHDYSRGSISAMLMMVKDNHGWPIGDFSQDIPCWRSCSEYPSETYYGDKSNALPCSFTPPRANSHPGMFVFDVHRGSYNEDKFTDMRPGNVTTSTSTEAAGPTNDPATSGTGGTSPVAPTVGPTFGPNPTGGTDKSTLEPKLFVIPAKSRRKGVREVHATWSFTQSTCNFASKIYIQTLILEEVRNGTNVSDAKFRVYGWTAQYNILIPTRKSLGAPDYVDLAYWKERDQRLAEIDCHVPMFDAPGTKMHPQGFHKGQVPHYPADTVTDVEVPTVQQYMFSLRGIATRLTFYKQYYGTHFMKLGRHATDVIPSECSAGQNIPSDDPAKKNPEPLPSVVDFLNDPKHKGIRCPCPALATPEPIENRTADPARLHGRLIHASHMAIAYMLLTPIACFIARYYKETFVTVFCFQEYWWYMWHVCILMVACIFNIGAILSITRRKQEVKLEQTDNLLVHVLLGAMSIFVFYMEIFTGFFRVSDPQKRMRQIFMHWLIGMTNNACAVGSMFAMAWVKSSGMSCKTVYSIIFWLIFVITCYIIMEYDMRRTDKLLDLKPKRTYLPPPIVRVFNRDAPGRNFRMGMLAVFIIGLVLLQLLVSYYIWHSEGDSCYEEYLSHIKNRRTFIDEGPDEEGNGGAVDLEEEEAA